MVNSPLIKITWRDHLNTYFIIISPCRRYNYSTGTTCKQLLLRSLISSAKSNTLTSASRVTINRSFHVQINLTHVDRGRKSHSVPLDVSSVSICNEGHPWKSQDECPMVHWTGQVDQWLRKIHWRLFLVSLGCGNGRGHQSVTSQWCVLATMERDGQWWTSRL